MGTGDGSSRSEADEPGDLLEASLAEMIVRELEIRDEFMSFCAELEELPREGPQAEGLREHLTDRAAELREFIVVPACVAVPAKTL
jgi:hypothetical protein